MMRNLRLRVAAYARHWSKVDHGIAATEFALIVPIMFVMFVGAVEMSQAITVDRRVSQVSSSTADLVARAENEIQYSEIVDIMKIGAYLLSPYSTSPLQVTIRNVVSSPANASQTTQTWQCDYAGSGQTENCLNVRISLTRCQQAS
jgi:Flp pilus assembly protein TadG